MKRLITICLICVLFVVGTAMGDWSPGDPNKWVQLPDVNGWDVRAMSPTVLADDWQCPLSGPVTDIHWWGSWKGDNEGTIENFNIGIYSNIPATSDLPSKPGELLWNGAVYGIDRVPRGREGWYNPDTGEYIQNDHAQYFQYNVVDIVNPFVQTEGTIYWLSITANVVPELMDPCDPSKGYKQWGWKSSIDHWGDKAVYGHPSTNPGDWLPLVDPVTGGAIDLAFVITPEPATICLFGLGALSLFRKKR